MTSLATADEKIAWIAKRCAERNLTLRQARFVFTSLHVADAIGACAGNQTKAADLLGIRREHLTKLMTSKLGSL